MGVGIPNGEGYGMERAAALGIFLSHTEKKLMILEDVTEEIREQAEKLTGKGFVEICCEENRGRIYIEAECQAGQEKASAAVQGEHTNIIFRKKNGRMLSERDGGETPLEPDFIGENLNSFEIADFCRFAEQADIGRLAKSRSAVEYAEALAEEGMKHRCGLSVGKALSCRELGGGSLVNTVQAMTAAAADARMSGCELPMMSLCGSGNQCIEATMPVSAAGRYMKIDEERLIRAAALSHLITIFVKQYTGRLSALCGCGIAAAIGAAAAIAWMAGGNETAVGDAVQNVAADVSGMICDGAKPGCALKLATAAGCAVQAAVLAGVGISATSRDGILSEKPEQTIRNLGVLDREGMQKTDQVILRLMTEKL